MIKLSEQGRCFKPKFLESLICWEQTDSCSVDIENIFS
jgi:hypothetical protein